MDNSLLCREERLARQYRLLSGGDVVVVQLTLNLPGSYDQYPWQDLLAEAQLCFAQQLKSNGLVAMERESGVDALGPWATFAMVGDGHVIKRLCIAVEETTPRGRLWDFDVLTVHGPIDRDSLGVRGRLCFVCGVELAHECRVMQKHAPQEAVDAAYRLAQEVGDTK